MEKRQTYTGRWIAVVMIIAFLGINYYRTEKLGGPEEQAFTQAKERQKQAAAFGNKILPPQNIEKLKFAYTGRWEKNKINHEHNFNPSEFTAPENQRNQIEATAAKKQDNKKKKKVAKKTKKKKSFVKKSRGKSRFDWDHSYGSDSHYSYNNNGYYHQQNPQNRTPSKDKEDEEKQLSVEEWLELVKSTNSVNELVGKYSYQKISSGLFYSVVSALLSSTADSDKRLGFSALQKVQSLRTLELYTEHINDEMSPETRNFAQNVIKAFNQPAHLRTLNAGLNNIRSEVRILSATLIRDITTSILASQSNTGENVVFTPQQIDQFKTLLTQSLLIINHSIDSTEGEVRVSFDSARSILNQFLG